MESKRDFRDINGDIVFHTSMAKEHAKLALIGLAVAGFSVVAGHYFGSNDMMWFARISFGIGALGAAVGGIETLTTNAQLNRVNAAKKERANFLDARKALLKHFRT